MKTGLVVVFILLASSEGAFAALSNIYIAQTSSGAANGTSCSNADPVSFFNTSSNWGTGSAQIGQGTTVHLCGIITSELSAQGGGASGNPVTILFEPGAKIQVSPGCDANGCLNLGGNSNFVIDGGTGQPCGWNTALNSSEGTCNGQIENMLYGSSDATCPGGACTTQAPSGNGTLITSSGSSNVEIRNLKLGPSYVHTSTGNGGNDTGGTSCVSLSGGSNWNIHDNKLDDGGWCITLTWAGSGSYSNWTIQNNEIYNSSHMVAVGGYNAPSLTNVTFAGNYTHDMANWDTSSDSWHADAIHFYGTSNQNLSGVAINNNIFGGNTGADVTGQIFSEEMASISGYAIFNNLFIPTTSPDNGASNYLFGPAQCSNCFFYNNTMARQTTTATNISLGYSTYVVSLAMENNVNQGGYTLLNVSTSSVTLSPLDYNAYGPNGGGIWVWLGNFLGTFSSWQSSSNEGSHSFYNSSGLGLSSAFKPNAGSPLIGAGVNVCTVNPSFCTSYPALKNDLAGVARPTSGAWDIGAYQYSNTGPTPTPTPNPSPTPSPTPTGPTTAIISPINGALVP